MPKKLTTATKYRESKAQEQQVKQSYQYGILHYEELGQESKDRRRLYGDPEDPEFQRAEW